MALLKQYHVNKDNKVYGLLTSQYTNHTYNYYMEVHLVSQDVVNNRSVIYVTAWGKSTSPTYQAWGGSAPYYVKVNGVQQASGTGINFSNTQTVPLGTTGNITINHNADGTGSFTASANFGYVASSLSKGEIYTQTITLPTIARATTPTLSVSSQNLGSAITVNTPRASTNFTHTVTYAFGGKSGTIGTNVATSVAWTLPVDLATEIPNSASGVGTIHVYTYSGSTHIGTKSINFTAVVPDTSTFRPTLSGFSVGISGSGRDKTISKYVQGISKVAVSFSATGKYNASVPTKNITIKRISDNGNTMSYSSFSITSGTLTLSGAYRVTISATDSRGRSSSTYTDITVEAYAVPKITGFTAVRGTPTTTVNTTRSGTYTYMGGSNPLTVNISKKLITDSTYTSLNTTAGTTSGTFTGSFASTGNADSSSYHFLLTVTDSFGNSATSQLSVSTASVALSIKSDIGIGVGKIWETGGGALDVAGGARFTGDMTVNGTKLKANVSRTVTFGTSYVYAFTVLSDGLAGSVMFTVRGTSGSVVLNTTVTVMVNHSGQIYISSESGNYTTIAVKVQSDGNSNFDVYLKHFGSTTTVATVDIFPLSCTQINLTSSGYATSVKEHTCVLNSFSNTGDVLATKLGGYTASDFNGRIEYVTNANGMALKYPDGTMIAWGAMSHNTVITSAWGTGFVTPRLNLAFPVQFINPPSFSHYFVNNAFDTVVPSYDIIYSHTAYFRYMRPAQMVSSVGGQTRWMAIGRWYT